MIFNLRDCKQKIHILFSDFFLLNIYFPLNRLVSLFIYFYENHSQWYSNNTMEKKIVYNTIKIQRRIDNKKQYVINVLLCIVSYNQFQYYRSLLIHWIMYFK